MWAAIIIGAVVVIGGGIMFTVNALRGSAWDSAATMPSGTAIYLNVDLDAIDDADRLFETFSGILEQADLDVRSTDDLVEMLDGALMDGAGFDYSNDVEPWLGRTAGLGILELDPEGEMVELIVSIAVTDGGAADGFIADHIDDLADGSYMTLDEITIDGTDVYHLDDEYGTEMFIARADEALVLTTSRSSMEQSIAAGRGDAESLADTDRFRNAISAIPSDPFVYAYVDLEWAVDFLNDAMAASGDVEGFGEALGTLGIDLGGIGEGGAEALVGSLAITDAGIELDVFAFGGIVEEVDVSQSPILEDLPASTTAFLAVGVDTENGLLGEFLDQLGPELDQSLAQLEAQLGIDIIDDFLALLSGDLALVLTDDDGGLGFGLALVLGLTDGARVADSVDTLAQALAAQGFPLIPGDPFYTIELPDVGPLAIGVEGDRFYVASGESLIDDIEGGGAKLVDEARFDSVRRELPGGPIVLYADVPGLLAQFDAEPEVSDALAPIEAVAVSTFTGNRTGVHVLVKVDWAG